MKRYIKGKVLTAFFIFLFLPMISNASETVTGTIVGFNSLIHGKESPIDSDDPHVDLEPDFVIQTSEGDHYLIPLIPRRLKVKYLYQTVKVTGDIIKKDRSISVDEFKIKKGEQFISAWTKGEWEEEQREIHRGGQ